MDYRKTAQEIYDHIGKKENIISAAHCATRLRLVIGDNAKADKEYIENIEGVKGVFFAQGQMQIILGTGVVNKVYDEFIQIAGVSESSKEDLKKVAASRANPVQRLIKTLGDIFVPIIPAIVASGFLMGIMEALNFMVNNGFLNIDTSGSIYTFAQLFSNTAYTFLPILIAYSGAKVFGANPYLGAVIGMIMIHPNLQNAWTVATEGVQATQKVWFGLYSIDMVGYQGHVIPVIIAVWVLAQIEKRLHKVVPAMFDLFVTPLVSVFVTGYLTLSIIGPIFVAVENGLLNGIQWLIALPFGIGSFIMGAFYAPTVVAGVHHMYTIIDLGQISKFGVTYWLPLASAANIAQGGATLAVALKTKDQKIKSMAVPSALSACMGITEPAIFGVNLRFGKPFVMGCVGGAVGALFASVTGLGATGTGVTGIFGILLCLNNPVSYILMFVIAFGAAFVLTWLFGYKDMAGENKTVEKNVENISAKGTENIERTKDIESVKTETGVTENKEISKMEETADNVEDFSLYSALEGTAIPMSMVNDATFASEVLGKGVAVIPAMGKVVAPCDATVETVFDTKHAVGLSTESGMELLIHIGINTVELGGKYYTTHVKDGDQVKKGQLLVSFDMDKIKEAGYDVTTPLIVTNSDDYKDVKVLREGAVTSADKVLEIVKA
jgi:PTS system sucrose-specific IIC component